MIDILRYADGKIMAVCEWWLLDSEGKINPEGNYLWVNELEIAPESRGNGVIKKIIRQISVKIPEEVLVGFLREYKYKGRKARVYRKDQFIKKNKEV